MTTRYDFDKVIKLLQENKVEDAAKYFTNEMSAALETTSFRTLMQTNPDFRSLVSYFQQTVNPKIIDHLSHINFPFSIHQKDIFREFLENKANSWNKLTTLNQFLLLINDKRIIKYMSLQNIVESYNSFIKIRDTKKISEQLSSLDLANSYKDFLLKIKNVTKDSKIIKIIESYLIQIDQYYKANKDKAISEMQKIEFKTQIPSQVIEEFKSQFNINPLVFIDEILPVTEIGIFQQMLRHSEFNITDLISVRHITDSGIETFHIDNQSSKVNTTLLKIITKILDEDKGGNLNSQRTPEKFLRDFYGDFAYKVFFFASCFSIKELYQVVRKIIERNKELPFQLVDLSGTPQIAHITQLFPILENRIRSLATKQGIFAKKESSINKIAYNDPSSLLTKIIVNNFDDHGKSAFNACKIELFLYLCLYSQNSLNIRNECIHCRDYFQGDKLVIGLKVTLICMILLMNYLDNC